MTGVPPKPLPPGVHVILGDSAAGTFTRVFHARDRMLIDQDVLSCGPTPKGLDLTEWNAVRREYWTTLVPADPPGHVTSPFDLVDHRDRLREAERIHVWAATSLSEQLFIANVIRMADLAGADPARISIVQFENLRERRGRVLGMGELDERYMADHPEPVELSASVLADYRTAWTTLTSDSPFQFESFSRERPDANRWLRQAMSLMLRRFPDARTGLTFWDFTLLAKVRERGPRAARVIGQAMADCWDDGDLTGDLYLFGRLLRLGDERLPRPLLQISGSRKSMRETEATLTSFGEVVLDGRASNYPTNPIEDWAGGVKLSSAEGKAWFNDDGKVVAL